MKYRKKPVVIEPERLHGVTTSLTFVYLIWARGVATSVPLDADITIHD